MNEQRPHKSWLSWFRMLIFVIEGNKLKFLGGVAIGLVLNSFVSATNPLALKYLFDEGIIRGNFRLFVIVSVAFILIFTLWRVGVYFYRLYIQKLKNDVFKQLCLR